MSTQTGRIDPQTFRATGDSESRVAADLDSYAAAYFAPDQPVRIRYSATPVERLGSPSPLGWIGSATYTAKAPHSAL